MQWIITYFLPFFLTNGWNQNETISAEKNIETKMGTRNNFWNNWESEEKRHNCKPEDL